MGTRTRIGVAGTIGVLGLATVISTLGLRLADATVPADELAVEAAPDRVTDHATDHVPEASPVPTVVPDLDIGLLDTGPVSSETASGNLRGTAANVASGSRVRSLSLMPLPQPAPLPMDYRADVAHVDFGRIEIPAIGVDEELGQGMTLTEIDRGPSHWPGTAEPGRLGNTVIAGHRTTYGAPFRFIDDLAVGDEIRFSTDAGTARYRVSEVFVVNPDAVWIADQERRSTVTLFACHPEGSAIQRIVVRGVLDTSIRPDEAL